MPPNNPAGYLDDDNAIPVDAQGNVHLNPDFRPDRDVEYGDGVRKVNI